jgi:16S rRNA (cytidine1402-2'-O)-methyltransferase
LNCHWPYQTGGVSGGSEQARTATYGLLVLCGAPIGDPRDASPRLAEVLATADVIAAEDTRRLRRLTAALGVTIGGRVVSYFEGNEVNRSAQLVEELRAGRTVAVVTDAGMPGVSDPGYRLVAAAAAQGVRVTVVPGPSAVTVALALSGLPSDRWVFEGFLPRRPTDRRRRIDELVAEQRTLVLLEAPHRVGASLADLAAGFGADRPAVIARELTKTYEEVLRGTLGELAATAAERELRGEITLVIGGATPMPTEVGRVELAAAVAALEADGLPRKDAISQVARDLGARRREVYDAVLAAKAGRSRDDRDVPASEDQLGAEPS